MDDVHSSFEEVGTLVLLNVPPGTELGIDMKIWTVGENFRGIKMIPPGIHFIHYSALNDYGEITPKTGFFYNFRKSEFVVKKWNVELQDVSLDVVPESEVVQLKDNIAILDKFLGPYPYSIWKKWTLLTSHITESLMNRLMPESGRVKAVLELTSCNEQRENTPRKCLRKPRWGDSLSEALETDLLPNLKPLPGTDIRLTSLPNRNYPEGSTPSEITQHSLDSTYSLEVMIEQLPQRTDIIGELQFSYVCFLVGHSIEAFEHWKNLVCLLCSCEVAIKKYCTLYDAFVTTLEVQVLETPPEFLADIVTNNNIVYLKLRTFFLSVSDSDVNGRFKTKVERFKHNLTDAFEWDFTHLGSDDEEDAPVIVELE